jgi:site-specific DNA-methyltransferase (adenine-specific)
MEINNNIVCGDCGALMLEMEEKCVDLTITSPPYDSLRDYKGYVFDFEKIACQLYRVTKWGSVIVWIVGDEGIKGSESGTAFKQALYFISLGLNLHDTMIYEKNGPSYPSQDKYYQTFEYMFVFSKGKPKTVNLLKDRRNIWTGSWGKRSRRNVKGDLIIGEKTQSGDLGIRFNVWRYNVGKGFTTKDDYAFLHPAMFPEELAHDHILSWSRPGDLVFDPMCGAGTTLKMAKQLGRRYLGFDISEEYCQLSKRRVEGAFPPLFVE